MSDIQTPPLPPEQAAPDVPKPPSKWPLRIAFLVVAALIAAVAGGRVLLRNNDKPAPQQSPAPAFSVNKTGKTVPVDLAGLPDGLTLTGAFTCSELKVAGGYTGMAEGGTITNASKNRLQLAFRFDVSSGTETQTVSRRFQLAPDDKIPTVTMASKHVSGHITACALAFLTDSGYDPAKSAAVREAATAAGCGKPEAHAIEGRDHIEPPAKATYKTTPPTSGNHYSSANPKSPANTGVHGQPIQNEIQVHNLEHGHIGVQYQGVGDATVNALVDGAKDNFGFAFVAPYPNMSQKIALTAWGVSLDCKTAPSDNAKLTTLVKAFIAAYADHAPESIPGTY